MKTKTFYLLLISSGIILILVLSPIWVLAKTKSPSLPGPESIQKIGNFQAPSGGKLQVDQKAVTESGNESSVSNGETVTYTIIITNVGDTTVNSIKVRNILPANTFADNQEDIVCSDQCYKNPTPVFISNLRGGEDVELAKVTEITWTIGSLAPGAVRSLTVSGRVQCQSADSSFTNSVFVKGVNSPSAESEYSLKTIISPYVDKINKLVGPTWCSPEEGGDFDTDWGDFDQDGDLDLALGSTRGTRVYYNDEGVLRVLWSEPSQKYTLGLKWVDVVDDEAGYLELIVLGYTSDADNSPTAPSINYIYTYQPPKQSPLGRFEEFSSFNSPFQLLRAAPADFDNDGRIDLAVSSTALNTLSCEVLLYRNRGGDKPFEASECLSNEATGSLAPADFDNDGDVDLALGLFQSKDIWIFRNEGGKLITETNSLKNVRVADNVSFLAYDFAWGDYNQDGFLDLMATYPLQREVAVYPNQGGIKFDSPFLIQANSFLSPRATSWADFDNDGQLELVMVDNRPKIYEYEAADRQFQLAEIQSSGQMRGDQTWSIHSLDQDGDGDKDVAVSNNSEASMLFTNFVSLLAQELILVNEASATDVRWGDVDGDNYLDLLFGAGPSIDGSDPNLKLYLNNKGSFLEKTTIDSLDKSVTAFADIDGDGYLGLSFSNLQKLSVCSDEQLLLGQASGCQTFLINNITSLAWGDSDEDSDHKPDLLIGVSNGPNMIYFNQTTGVLALTKGWTSNDAYDTRSVAWGSYNSYGANRLDSSGDRDSLLDFAVANYGAPDQLYRNNGDNTFSLVWSSPISDDKSTSLAWGDYDGDGDRDLVIGTEGQNRIYQNRYDQYIAGDVSEPFALVWSFPETDKTTSLAWGDWDNDGDLDLAVGNSQGEHDLVYVNMGGASDEPDFQNLWRSEKLSADTTNLAWGDKDNDGDLDLAVSRNGNNASGVYENYYVSPGHLTSRFDPATIPLPNNPSYLSFKQVSKTAKATELVAAEVLGEGGKPITLTFTVFDPDGSRQLRNEAGSGDPIRHLSYEFSRQGYGYWEQATMSSETVLGQTPGREGMDLQVEWNVVEDLVFSNNVRFRICAAYQPRVGPTQRASACAVSPIFRVRSTTCVWPDEPEIILRELEPTEGGVVYQIQGKVHVGTGQMFYEWYINDLSTPVSESTSFIWTFDRKDTYLITMIVTGEPCPVAHSVQTTYELVTGYSLYLPLIAKDPSAAPPQPATSVPTPATPIESSLLTGMFAANPGSPSAVPELQGNNQAGVTHLTWPANPAAEAVSHYNIYRSTRSGPDFFQLLATVPADTTNYTDDTDCGYMYMVTASNEQGESLPGLVSYYSPSCR